MDWEPGSSHFIEPAFIAKKASRTNDDSINILILMNLEPPIL
jgi:hypothetical protein